MIKIENPYYLFGYQIHVSILPFIEFRDAAKLLPYRRWLIADYDPGSLFGHSASRWSGLMEPCILFSKFIISYFHASKEQLKDYEIVEDVRFFMSKDKYEVFFDRDYNRNGKKYKITIKTGAQDSNGNAVYCPIDDMKSFIRKMISEIGFIEAEIICKDYSPFTDRTKF